MDEVLYSNTPSFCYILYTAILSFQLIPAN